MQTSHNSPSFAKLEFEMTAVSKPFKKPLLLPEFPDKFIASLAIAHFLNIVAFYLCVKSALAFQSVDKALAFYGVYHREPWNQVIHFFCVPFILWTMLVGSAHLVISSHKISGLPYIPPHYVSWATVWAILYSVFYLSLDLSGALMFAPVMYGMYATAVRWVRQDQTSHVASNKASHWLGTGKLMQLAIVLHFFSWYLQIHPGHKVLEGAQPASASNLGGALTTAPLFAFYEGVWFLGFRREFQERVLRQVAVYTQELCENGAAMRVCSLPQ